MDLYQHRTEEGFQCDHSSSRTMRALIILCLIFASARCEVPSNFKRCNRKDQDFKKCLFEAGQNAMEQLTRPYKSLDMPNVDPLDIPIMTLKGDDGPVAIDQNYKDCKVSGLTSIKFDTFEVDFERDVLEAGGLVPEVKIACHYNIDGKILLLSMQGEGNSTITMRDFHPQFRAQYKKVTKRNKTHFESVNTELNLTMSNVHFQFDNLFNGNKQLGDNINQVMNDNWEEVFGEMKPQFLEIIRQILTMLTDRVWKKVSLEELFDKQ